MLLKVLNNLIFFLGNIRENIIDKYYPEQQQEDYSWMDRLAEEYEKCGLE